MCFFIEFWHVFSCLIIMHIMSFIIEFWHVFSYLVVMHILWVFLLNSDMYFHVRGTLIFLCYAIWVFFLYLDVFPNLGCIFIYSSNVYIMCFLIDFYYPFSFFILMYILYVFLLYSCFILMYILFVFVVNFHSNVHIVFSSWILSYHHMFPF